MCVVFLDNLAVPSVQPMQLITQFVLKVLTGPTAKFLEKSWSHTKDVDRSRVVMTTSMTSLCIAMAPEEEEENVLLPYQLFMIGNTRSS